MGGAEAEGERGSKERKAGEASTRRGVRGKQSLPRRKSWEGEVAGSSKMRGSDLVEFSMSVASRTSMISGDVWAAKEKW